MSVVLLVEDSPNDQTHLRTILRQGGYEVHEVSRGGDVLSEVLDVRPLLVLLSTQLLNQDGRGVCRMLRDNPALAGLPVLMVAESEGEEAILAGLEAGADDFITRNAAPAVVLARVNRLVRFRQLASLALLNEQLAQIGRLVAGIVHEIRGPLTVIRGNAELMQTHYGPHHETEKWLEPILRNASVLQQRLEHLMVAVRDGPALLKRLDLAPVIREAIDFFTKGNDARRDRITLETSIDEALPSVLVDAGRLLQVLLNLLNNAQDAILGIRSEGRISVSTETHNDERGTWAQVRVKDTGPGIPADYLSRVFEPFFTTKPQGSGYGLYLANEILREHGGMLTVENLDGGGACFTLWLPLKTAAPPSKLETP